MGQGYRGVAKDVAEDEASVADRFDDDSQAKAYTQTLLNQLDDLQTPEPEPEPEPDPSPGKPGDSSSEPPTDTPPAPPEPASSYEDYLSETTGGTDTTPPETDLWDARTRPEPDTPAPEPATPPGADGRALDPDQVEWDDPLIDNEPDPTDTQSLGDVATIDGDIHGLTNDGQPLVDPQGSMSGVTNSQMDADAADGIRGETGAESNYVAVGDTTELNPQLAPDGKAVTAGIVDTVPADYDPDVVLESYQDYLETELDTEPNTDPARLDDIKAQNEALDSQLLDEHGERQRPLTREEADRLFAERHAEYVDEDAPPWSGRSSLEGNEHKLGVAKADAAYNESLRERNLLPETGASDDAVAATSEYAEAYVSSLRDDLVEEFEPQESAGGTIPEQDFPNGPKKPIEIPSDTVANDAGDRVDSGTTTVHVPDWSHAPDAHCGGIRDSKPHPYDGQRPPDDWLVQWQGERMPKDPDAGVDTYVTESEATNYLLDMDSDLRANVRGRALGMAQRDGAPDTKEIELKIAAAAQRRGDIISGVEYVRDHLQHYGPSTTPIEDLDELASRGMTNASVEARVERTLPPRNPESQHQYFELREKKNGKRLQVFSWKKSDPETEVREGDYVVIRNAELQSYRDTAQLSTRSYTDISVKERANPDAPSRAAPAFAGFTPKDANRNAIGAETDHTDAVPLEKSGGPTSSSAEPVDWSGLFGDDGMLVDHSMERSGEGDRMIRRRDRTSGREVDVGELREFESRTKQTDKRLVEHTGEN